MNPVAIRLLNQQLAAPQFSKPEEVVSHFGAMQAQEYRMMRWAVAMRTRRPSATAFTRAYNEGKIIRLHLLRGTWQLVTREDYWWMLDLCGTKARQVISGWMSSNKIDIPTEELTQIRSILTEVTQLKRSATKEDFAEELVRRGIKMDDHRLSYHIRFAELDGVLCSGDLLPQKATYALVSQKIGLFVKQDREESLKLLARKYFQSHQPATLEDFVWWSGLGINECRRALELLDNDIHTVEYKGRAFYLLNDCRIRGFRRGEYLLLPPYDEYLIGYKSRDIVLDPQFRHHAHNNSGIFQPVVAFDGTICGNWSPTKKGSLLSFFIGNHEAADSSAIYQEYNSYLNR